MDVGELVGSAVAAVLGVWLVIYLITHLPW